MENAVETGKRRGEAEMMVSKPIQLYPNEKIAGTSEKVTRVYISQEFAFDGFTIIVERVPAYRDDETGKQYVPGGIAMFVSDAVMEEAQKIQEEIAHRSKRFHRPIRRRFDAWSGHTLLPV